MVNLGLVRADQSGTCQRRADCGDAAHDSKPGTNTYRSGAEPVTEGVEPLTREQGISPSDGEAKPMRFTSAKGYAPAVIMWAHHMPSAETKICLTRDEIWLDLNEDYYNELMRVLSSTG